MVAVAQTFAAVLAVYAAVGLLFAAAFVTAGAGRIDPSARHAPLGFRLVIFPGAAALWPLLAIRWLRGQQPPAEKTAHRALSASRPAAPRRQGDGS